MALGSSAFLCFTIPNSPTAEWTARQVIEAAGIDDVPRFLVRDRDRKFSEFFSRQVQAVGLSEVPTAPASSWQNAYAERVIGSMRREYRDHTIILGERHLRRTVKKYVDYYNDVRTHLSLDKNFLVGFGLTVNVCANLRISN